MSEAISDRERLQAMFPDKPIEWLAGADDALAGLALRCDEVTPAYWLNRFTDQISKAFNPAKTWELFKKAALSKTPCIFIWTPCRERFWNRVRNKELVAWDNMTPAITGVTVTPFEMVYAAVYDWDKAIVQMLDTNRDPSSTPADERYDTAIASLVNLSSLNAGPTTPYFLIT